MSSWQVHHFYRFHPFRGTGWKIPDVDDWNISDRYVEVTLQFDCEAPHLRLEIIENRARSVIDGDTVRFEKQDLTLDTIYYYPQYGGKDYYNFAALSDNGVRGRIETDFINSIFCNLVLNYLTLEKVISRKAKDGENPFETHFPEYVKWLRGINEATADISI